MWLKGSKSFFLWGYVMHWGGQSRSFLVIAFPQGYEFIEGLLLLGCTDAHNMSV